MIVDFQFTLMFDTISASQHLLRDTSTRVVATDTVITKSFFQKGPVDVDPTLLSTISYDWMVYLILVILLGLGLAWYYFPERVLSIFKIAERKNKIRRGYAAGDQAPGILFQLYFLGTAVLSIVMFFFLLINGFIKTETFFSGEAATMFYLLIFVIILIFYRIIMIRLTGILFDTRDLSIKQMRLYINIDNLTGVLLVPVLVIILFSQLGIFYYVGFGIIFILYIIKWLQTFLLSRKVSGFSVLHLFMYLCALELIPVLVLVKLFQNEFFK